MLKALRGRTLQDRLSHQFPGNTVLRFLLAGVVTRHTNRKTFLPLRASRASVQNLSPDQCESVKISGEVFLFPQHLDHPRGISSRHGATRHIMSHDRSRRNHRVIPNRHPF
jgi:hypothetical protein